MKTALRKCENPKILTLHESVQLIAVVFQDANRLGVVGPVGQVRRLDVGAVVEHDAANTLVPRVSPSQTGSVLGG